jgi:hypothetical protein
MTALIALCADLQIETVVAASWAATMVGSLALANMCLAG